MSLKNITSCYQFFSPDGQWVWEDPSKQVNYLQRMPALSPVRIDVEDFLEQLHINVVGGVSCRYVLEEALARFLVLMRPAYGVHYHVGVKELQSDDFSLLLKPL